LTVEVQPVRGMNDVLPAEIGAWQQLEACIRELLAAYGYEEIRVPVVEHTALFKRAIGEFTDVVEKEMYTFPSQGGESLTLRPEATAGIVRAMVEHNALYNGPLRVWSEIVAFRHERPQKGRYRQFHQIDVEALGHAGPDVDAEQILMCRALLADLGLAVGSDVRLELNSLGQPAERSAHRAALVAHLEQHADALDGDSKRRLHTNPLRVLDSRNPALQATIESAPRLLDFLGADSLAHFDAVRRILDAAGLEYRINPRLVRGMDYYNLTVFEWVTDRLGAQGTVCGGGRYDGLFEQLGGKRTPAVGWGMGIERMLLLLEAAGVAMAAAAADAYAIVPSDDALPVAMTTCDALRALGVAVTMYSPGSEGRASMKSQFKRANASGARFALVFGADELARGAVGLKDLQSEATPQTTLPLQPVEQLAERLKSASPRPS